MQQEQNFGNLMIRVVQGDQNAKETIIRNNTFRAFGALGRVIGSHNKKHFPPIFLDHTARDRWANKVLDPVIKKIKDNWEKVPSECNKSFQEIFSNNFDQEAEKCFEKLMTLACEDLVNNSKVNLSELEKQLQVLVRWRRCMAKLSPSHREAITLRVCLGKTEEECAAQCNCDGQAFATILKTAIEKHKQCMAPYWDDHMI